MFILKDLGKVDFVEMLKRHLLYVATSDVYFQNARMINGHHKYMDLKDYNEYWKNFLNDIELVTEPIDAFVPSFSEEEDVEVDPSENDRLFMVNRVGPEYEKIKNRCNFEEIKKTFPPTHPVMEALMEDASRLDDVIDDIYIYWSVTKYLQTLDTLRLQILSNMTPGIEYVVKNIDEKAVKRHLHTSKIRLDKFESTIRDMFFRPDYQFTKAFYDQDREDFPRIDVELLFQKLTTNIDTKSDTAVIVALYLTMSFAMTDIKNHNIENSECAKYVRDVLSKF